MDISDLKSAWDKYSSQEMDKHRLGKDSILDMLKNRTKSLVERIDRNIRFGMAVLLAFIAYVIVDDLYLSKILIQEPAHYPGWMVPIDVFSNLLIVTTYLFFVIRYFKIKRSFSADRELRNLLTGILETLQTYRRMFYLAVIILLINIAVSFVAGFYQGIKLNADAAHGGIQNLSSSKILIIIGSGLGVLILLVGITFVILRWGFNKLYGRYMLNIQETIQELDEPEIQESELH